MIPTRMDRPASREESGYGREEPRPDERTTRVGRGSPAGEWFRRYWQPVGLADELSGDLAKPVRVLGEDLVLFRDAKGDYGLLDARCAHRGTSLYYGRVEPQGIRCCYHGWLFDTSGRCLDQPCEPKDSTYKERVRQPWYPCREYLGLVFAYLGPLDRLPAFPRFDVLEAGEGAVVADGTSYGLGGGEVLDCNWLQIYENVMDPFHVFVLHNAFSGQQFSQALAARPRVSWEATARGMRSIQDRGTESGGTFRRITEVLLPNVRIVPSVGASKPGGSQRAGHVGFILPIDDTHTRMYSLLRVPLEEGRPLFPPRARHGGKLWSELTREEHRRMPGDAEAMVSQGPIAARNLEHLASSDRGVILVRRRIEEAIDAVGRGEDPPGVTRGVDQELVETTAGNFLLA
jgi:nitrite reductase/ring-hydroxylating ferredoxin subunit